MVTQPLRGLVNFEVANDGRYCQAKLEVLAGAAECVVNFRVVLPDAEEAWEHEVTIPVQ